MASFTSCCAFFNPKHPQTLVRIWGFPFYGGYPSLYWRVIPSLDGYPTLTNVSPGFLRVFFACHGDGSRFLPVAGLRRSLSGSVAAAHRGCAAGGEMPRGGMAGCWLGAATLSPQEKTENHHNHRMLIVVNGLIVVNSG